MLSIVTCIFWQRSKRSWKLILCLIVTCRAALFQILLLCTFMVFPALLSKILYSLKTKSCSLPQIPFYTCILHHILLLLVTHRNRERDSTPMEVNTQIQSWACTIGGLTRSKLGKRNGSTGSASFLINRGTWLYLQGSAVEGGGDREDSAVL